MKKVILAVCVLSLIFVMPVFAGETTDADRQFQAAEAQKDRDFKAQQGQIDRDWQDRNSRLDKLSNNAKIIGDTARYFLMGTVTAFEVRQISEFEQMLATWFPEVINLDIYIDSGGGQIDDGFALADIIELLNRKYNLRTIGFGTVASAAILPFVAGEHRVVNKNCFFMLHGPKVWKYYTEEGKNDIRAQNEMMDLIISKYASFLSEKTKLSVDDVNALCDKITWFGAEHALEWGMIDNIL